MLIRIGLNLGNYCRSYNSNRENSEFAIYFKQKFIIKPEPFFIFVLNQVG